MYLHDLISTLGTIDDLVLLLHEYNANHEHLYDANREDLYDANREHLISLSFNLALCVYSHVNIHACRISKYLHFIKLCVLFNYNILLQMSVEYMID